MPRAYKSSPEPVTLEQVLHYVKNIQAGQVRIEQAVNSVMTVGSRKKQAKKLGVHPSTLWRRQQRLRMRLMAEGRA